MMHNFGVYYDSATDAPTFHKLLADAALAAGLKMADVQAYIGPEGLQARLWEALWRDGLRLPAYVQVALRELLLRGEPVGIPGIEVWSYTPGEDRECLIRWLRESCNVTRIAEIK